MFSNFDYIEHAIIYKILSKKKKKGMVEALPEQSPTILKYSSTELEAEEEEEKKEIVVAT